MKNEDCGLDAETVDQSELESETMDDEHLRRKFRTASLKYFNRSFLYDKLDTNIPTTNEKRGRSQTLRL